MKTGESRYKERVKLIKAREKGNIEKDPHNSLANALHPKTYGRKPGKVKLRG